MAFELNKQEIQKLIDTMFPEGKEISEVMTWNYGTPANYMRFKQIGVDPEYNMKLEILQDNAYFSRGDIVDYYLCFYSDGMYAWRNGDEPAMYVYFDDENQSISFGS